MKGKAIDTVEKKMLSPGHRGDIPEKGPLASTHKGKGWTDRCTGDRQRKDGLPHFQHRGLFYVRGLSILKTKRMSHPVYGSQLSEGIGKSAKPACI